MFACSTEIMRNHGLKNIKDIMVIMRDVYIYIYIYIYTCNTLCAKKTSSCKTAIIIVVTIEKFRFHKKMSFDVRHPAALETKG